MKEGSMGRHWKRCAAIVLTASLTSGAVALGAGLKKDSDTVELAGETGSAIAKCKRGTQAVSGGFAAEVDASDSDPIVAAEHSARKGKRKWRTSGVETVNGSGGKLTSHAYCAADAGNVKSKKSRLVSVAPPAGSNFDDETATAKCPPGTKVVSGGPLSPDFDSFEFGMEPQGSAVVPQASQKVGARKWRAIGLNAGADAGDFGAQANCREGAGLKTKRDSGEFETGSSSSSEELTAKCSRSQRVISGGFRATTGAADVVAIITGSEKRGARSWRVRFVLPPDSAATVTAFAYCEDK
jgi:hypothetical protein